MKAACTMRMVVIASLAGIAVAFANNDALAERYSYIPQRNAFALKPAPVVIEQPKPEKPQSLVAVKLTAIIGLSPTKKAILLVSEPGKPAESKVLSENQLESGVEVKEINPETGHVKVVVNGQNQDLNFEKDGVKPTFTAAPSPPPAVSATALFSSAANDKGITPIGAAKGTSLSSFLHQASAAASARTGSGAPVAPTAYPGGYNGMPNPIAGQTFRFDGSPTAMAPQPKWPPEIPVSQEESIIHMEILKTLQERGDVVLPPLPPTIMSPATHQKQD